MTTFEASPKPIPKSKSHETKPEGDQVQETDLFSGPPRWARETKATPEHPLHLAEGQRALGNVADTLPGRGRTEGEGSDRTGALRKRRDSEGDEGAKRAHKTYQPLFRQALPPCGECRTTWRSCRWSRSRPRLGSAEAWTAGSARRASWKRRSGVKHGGRWAQTLRPRRASPRPPARRLGPARRRSAPPGCRWCRCPAPTSGPV